MKEKQAGLRETEEFKSLQKFEVNERCNFCGDDYFMGCLDAVPTLAHAETLAMKNTEQQYSNQQNCSCSAHTIQLLVHLNEGSKTCALINNLFTNQF